MTPLAVGVADQTLEDAKYVCRWIKALLAERTKPASEECGRRANRDRGSIERTAGSPACASEEVNRRASLRPLRSIAAFARSLKARHPQLPCPWLPDRPKYRRFSFRFMLQPAKLLASRPSLATCVTTETFTSKLSPPGSPQKWTRI
jgi:hypothetical protein